MNRRFFLNSSAAATAVLTGSWATPRVAESDGAVIYVGARRELFGDTVNRAVGWKTGSDVSRLNGQSVRLRFELRDADLYAMQFGD